MGHMGEDGFMEITPEMTNRGGAKKHHTVTFGKNSVRVPAPEGASRADWAWDGKDTLRLRFHDAGRLKVSQQGVEGASRYVSVGLLYSVIGTMFHGEYPCRLDGNDLYIMLNAKRGWYEFDLR